MRPPIPATLVGAVPVAKAMCIPLFKPRTEFLTLPPWALAPSPIGTTATTVGLPGGAVKTSDEVGGAVAQITCRIPHSGQKGEVPA